MGCGKSKQGKCYQVVQCPQPCAQPAPCPQQQAPMYKPPCPQQQQQQQQFAAAMPQIPLPPVQPQPQVVQQHQAPQAPQQFVRITYLPAPAQTNSAATIQPQQSQQIPQQQHVRSSAQHIGSLPSMQFSIPQQVAHQQQQQQVPVHYIQAPGPQQQPCPQQQAQPCPQPQPQCCPQPILLVRYKPPKCKKVKCCC